VVNVVAQELANLRNVTAAEVELAKQSLKTRVSLEHTSSWRRLEDRVKGLFYTGSAQTEFGTAIDGVSVSDIQNAVSQALKTPLTFVAQGGEVNRIQSYDNLSKLLQ
jgi:predicted Zn-dependent peptidase